MARVKSMRGETIDFNRMIQIEGDTRALGNVPMNARGDILDQKGKILKTQSQIEEEWRIRRRRQDEQEQVMDIKRSMTSEEMGRELNKRADLPNAAENIVKPQRRKVENDQN